MADRHDRDDWRRERSLHALGRTLRGDDRHTRSWREDAVARHRQARALRTALPVRPQPAKTNAGTRPPARDGSGLSAKVLADIVRSKWLILGTTLAGAALGIAVALSMPEKYEAVTELIVSRRDLGPTGQDMLISRAVLDQVVEKLDLAGDPEFNGEAGTGLASRLRSLLERPGTSDEAGEASRGALAAGRLAGALSVGRAGGGPAIRVGVTTRDGEKSALIADTLAEVFLQAHGGPRADMAAIADEASAARLAELRKGAEEAGRRAEEFRAAHGLTGTQDRPAAADESGGLEEQLAAARARTEELEARAAAARSARLDAALGGTLADELNTVAMEQLRARYAALKQEADLAAVRLGPLHPERRALDVQLAGARERVGAELRRMAAALKAEAGRAAAHEQELSARLEQLKAGSGGGDDALAALRELERDAAARRSAYETALAQAASSQIDTSGARVVSRAQAPLAAKGPSRVAVSLAALLLGLFAGVCLGAVRGMLTMAPAAPRSPRRPEPCAAIGDRPRAPPQPSIESVCAELRDFGEAVRNLADSRARSR